MSPDLERLLNALWETREGEPEHAAKWKAAAERMISDALSRCPPGTSHEEFMEAIEIRYTQLRRSRRKPSALPPQA